VTWDKGHPNIGQPQVRLPLCNVTCWDVPCPMSRGLVQRSYDAIIPLLGTFVLPEVS